MVVPQVLRSCGRSHSPRENERSRVLYYWKPISCYLPSSKIESHRHSVLYGTPIVQALTQSKMYFSRPRASDRSADFS
jgi:hypothetical protein